MSRTIDERVVEMRFDNKQFEQGAKETMTTLDKLKNSLNLEDSAKSFDKLDKAANSVSLEGISAGIEALQKRFSTLGIVGMRVIENITDSLMNMASKAMSYVNDAIVSGGLRRAQNIENAHFQLQALLKDEMAVQAVMDDAMASVDGTAYAYDEAAKAASQFAASGMRAGEDMQSALRGITGVAAMTNSQYEDIARIFTTVAGNGRLMGDQLLQLSSRGLNAAATVADYFREVQGQAGITESKVREMVTAGEISFQTFAAAMDWAFGESAFRANETFTGALSNMKSALARIGAGFFSPLIEQNSDLILLINTLRERINDVKKAVVFDEQASAISGLTKVTNLQTDALEEMFKTIDENGAVSTENLKALADSGEDVTKALTNYINGVTDGSVRATYATKTALNDLTGGLKVSESQVRQFVEEGKIDLKTFTSAMEESYGDLRSISKQFTDTVLDMAASVSEYLSNLDLTKPLEIFHYGVETVKNVFKGLYSVLKPIGQAFADVFLSFSIDDVVNIAEKIENLTSKMRLSEEQSKNLHDAFAGIFGIIKLVIDGFLGLIGVVVPVGKPIGSLTDLVLSLAGALGRALTSFKNWVNGSTLLNKVYKLIASNVQKAMSAVAGFISRWDEFVDYIYNLPIVQKIISSAMDTFNKLYVKSKESIVALIERMKELGKQAAELIPEKVHEYFSKFIRYVVELASAFRNLDFSIIIDKFKKLKDVFKSLLEVLKGNEGLDSFITNMKQWFVEFAEAFSIDSITGKIDTFKKAVGGFIDWVKTILGPFFENFSIGGAVATAGGVGIIYAIIKISKSFEKISGALSSIPSLFGAVKSTLVAYQKDLKADMLLKIAKAIGILAVSITILSFADMDRAYKAMILLGAIGAELIVATSKLVDAGKKGATIETVLNTLSKGITKSLNNLAKAIKWKAIGAAFKDMGVAIGLISASILALAYGYSKDAESMNKAVVLIGILSSVMLGLFAIISILGSSIDSGVKNFEKIGRGLLEMAATIGIIVFALKTLFEIEIGDDWIIRLGILTGVFLNVGGLVIAVAYASKLAEGGKLSSATTLLAAAGMVYIIVLAVRKLFEMKMPDDWVLRLGILTGIFLAVGGLIIAVGYASKLAGGQIKAAATLLAMCVTIATITAALGILSIFPGDKLLIGAVSLGMVLVALGVSMALAANITGKTNYKTVLAMAVQVGVITAALGILSMVPLEALTKAAIVLGAMLLALAADFYAISKITDKLSYVSILAMALNVGVIAVALHVLANQPWESLVAAGASLGVVLTAVAGSFYIISKTKVDATAIASFLLGTVGVIVIGVALAILAKQPWEAILSAGASISAVLLAMAGAIALLDAVRPNIAGIISFILGIVGISVIGIVLYELAKQPWENLLAAAASISLVFIAMSAALLLCTAAGIAAPAAILGIALLDAFIINLGIILVTLGALSDVVGPFIDAGGQVLIKLGTYLGEFIGSIIAGVMEAATSTLPVVGENLSQFANNAKPFFDIVGSLDGGVLTGVKNLAEVILILAGATFINALSDFMSTLLGSSGMAEFGSELKTFGDGIHDFADSVEGISADNVTAASNAALALAQMANNLPNQGGVVSWFTGDNTLSVFGDELVEFGPKFKEFADSIKGISAEDVTAAGNAGLALAQMASALPNQGGVVSWFTGDNTLSVFGDELIEFGPKLKEFSDAIIGVNPSAVQAAAEATTYLGNMAKELPNSGGVVSWFTGDNTLSIFGEDLAVFGPALKAFSIAAQGVSKDAVQAAAEATTYLGNMAKELPNSGGVVSWFTGDNTLSIFGEDLAVFGPALKAFSDSAKDIDPGAVQAAAEATLSIIGMASQIENEGGVAAFFAGDNTLTNLANHLTVFGPALKDFSDSVSGVDAGKIDSVIKEVEKLITIATDISGLDTVKIYGFTNALASMANEGIDSFVTAFEGSSSKVISSVDSLMKAIETEITTYAKSLKTSTKESAENAMQAFVNGFTNKRPLAVSTVKNVCSAIITAFRSSLPSSTFTSLGQTVGLSLITGITSKKSEAIQASNSMSNAIIQAFKSVLTQYEFRIIGEYAAQGLAIGITNKINEIRDAAIAAAEAAIAAAKAALDEHSPSKKFEKLGEYGSIGLANGFINKLSFVARASEKVADESIAVVNKKIKRISDLLRDTDDFDPVIRPVFDMSNVENGINEISEMFNKGLRLRMRESLDIASDSFSNKSKNSLDRSDENHKETGSNSFQFIQNNYSPEALSRAEIYRQSKNLFSTWKGAVEGT